MSVSKAPTYRAAMFALINSALAGQTGIEINYGSTWVSGSADIVLLRSVTKRGDFAALGAGSLKEFLDLEIVIICDRGDDAIVNGVPTQQIASERAWALLALIETKVRTDITLGLPQPFWVINSHAQEVEGGMDDAYSGRHSELSATFTAETRI